MAEFVLNKTLTTGVDADWNYKSVGKLRKICTGYTLRFGNKNLKRVENEKGDYNRVVIFAKKGDELFNIPCSKPLSETIRTALKTIKPKQLLGALIDLEIQAEIDNEEKYFLMQPEGMTEGFAMEDLAEVEDVATYEEIIAVF